MSRLSTPETPYIVGGLALTAANLKSEGKLTGAAFGPTLAIIGVVVLASFTAGTSLSSIVRAFGWLFAIAAIFRAVNVYTSKETK